jgi:hypothetical protein
VCSLPNVAELRYNVIELSNTAHCTVVAMPEEATADTYRRYAKHARAEAETAENSDLKRQWNETAATYEGLAAAAEQAALKRSNP